LGIQGTLACLGLGRLLSKDYEKQRTGRVYRPNPLDGQASYKVTLLSEKTLNLIVHLVSFR
jgi:hypothetical protein